MYRIIAPVGFRINFPLMVGSCCLWRVTKSSARSWPSSCTMYLYDHHSNVSSLSSSFELLFSNPNHPETNSKNIRKLNIMSWPHSDDEIRGGPHRLAAQVVQVQLMHLVMT